MVAITRERIVGFAALFEMATGVALLGAPLMVVPLLLGTAVTGGMTPLCRVAGIALLALGVACLPERGSPGVNGGAFRSMLIYNGLAAPYLAWLGMRWHPAGPLLWPAVVLHAVVIVLLLWRRPRERA